MGQSDSESVSVSSSRGERHSKNVPIELLRRTKPVTRHSELTVQITPDHECSESRDESSKHWIVGRSDLVFSVRKVMEEFNERDGNELTDEKIKLASSRVSDIRKRSRRKSFKWKCLSAFCDIVTLILPVLTVVLDVEKHIKLITVFTWVTVSVRITATVFRISDKGVIYNYIAIRYSQIISKLESLNLISQNRRARKESFISLLCEAQDLSITVDSENTSLMGML